MNFVTTIPHPYGVKPFGNIYFESNLHISQTRQRGLGYFSKLTDEAVIEILSYLPGPALAVFCQLSRAFYVYSHHSDLWRDLTLLKCGGEIVRVQNSWKDTYVWTFLSKLHKEHSFRSHIPIPIIGIFSNLLHRAWACHSCDLSQSCPGIMDYDDIPRIDSSNLSVEKFIEQYEKPNIPVIIQNAVNDWPAMKKWNADYFISTCGDSRFRSTSATAPLAASFTMDQYFQYEKIAKEEAPLYLFDRNFLLTSPSFSSDYRVPDYFHFDHHPGTDLFRVLGEKERPDYRWLIAGPARSGSIFHIDPNQTNAWNVCIQGRKKWIFYPPGVPPPGVACSEDQGDATVPVSTGEWLLSFWPEHLKARNNPNPALRPLETVVGPGELIFVPNGFWHMVLNLDDCIAITHNYVSTSNLPNCLHFLRDKKDQITGVRDRCGEEISTDTIFDQFVSKLESILPADVIQRSVHESIDLEKKFVAQQRSKLKRQKRIRDDTILEDSKASKFSFDFNLES